MEQLNVAIADDNQRMITTLNRLLKEDKEINVVGTAMDGTAAFELIREKKPDIIFVNHGEDEVTKGFAECLQKEEGFPLALAPYSGTVYDLTADEVLLETEGIPIKKDEDETKPAFTAKQKSTPYVRLEKTGERLMALIHASRGLSNEDLAKFASQLAALCDKWED